MIDIEVFNSRGELRDLSQIEVDNLPPEDLQRFEALRSAYLENRDAEQIAADLAKELAVAIQSLRAARLETQKQKPYSELQGARDWIETQRIALAFAPANRCMKTTARFSPLTISTPKGGTILPTSTFFQQAAADERARHHRCRS